MKSPLFIEKDESLSNRNCFTSFEYFIFWCFKSLSIYFCICL